jgi:uncharacterized protein YabE (DUF348 family)
MEHIFYKPRHHYRIFVTALIALAVFGVIFGMTRLADAQGAGPSTEGRIITLHDDGVDKGFMTKQTTLREALKEAGVRLDARDRTEPGLDEKLVASSYQVNIYRARPVLIRDGSSETKIVTAYRTAKQIAKQVGITVHDADKTTLSPSKDPIADGTVEVMNIERATAFTFEFYGKTETSYTRARTVGAMLREKNITMGEKDGITPGLDTPITAGMSVKLWRDGTQTVTVEEDVAYTTKQVNDADHDIGYKEVQTKGENGKRTVTYEITTQNGTEVARKEINSNVTKQPVDEVVVVGTKNQYANGLSKAKGVVYSTDSNGVTHRETYYDLNMSAVMRNCGAGGQYTVRADGVKVDGGGYIIVAANLSRYPRCSVVETSLGPGKVYDTGGFVSSYPDGFDLATDWSDYNGI